MVPKYPAARARINRNGSDSSGSEISCDTGTARKAEFFSAAWINSDQTGNLAGLSRERCGGWVASRIC